MSSSRKFKIDKSKIVNAINWIAVIVVGTAVSLFFLWFYIFKIDPKTISIINLYPQTVKVNLLNQQITMQAFDTAVVNYYDRVDFTINVTDTNDKPIQKIDVTGLKLPPQLVEVVLSAKKQYCFYSINLTNYLTGQGDLSDLNSYSSDATTYQVFKLDSSNINTYPGFDNKTLSGNQVLQSVIGFYPINCSDLADNQKVLQNVNLYRNYDAAAQRNYLDQKTKQVQDSSNIDDIQNIK